MLWQRRRRRASQQTQAAAATLLKSVICAFHAAAIEGATARVEAERNGHRKRLGRAFSFFRLATLEVQPRGRAAMRRTKLGWQGVRSRLANSIDDLLRRRVILYLFSLSFQTASNKPANRLQVVPVVNSSLEVRSLSAWVVPDSFQSIESDDEDDFLEFLSFPA